MRASNHLRFGAAVLLVGLAGAAFAIAFRLALHGALDGLFHQPDVVAAFGALPRPWRVVTPALGGLLAGLAGLAAARGAGGHGVADVLEAVVLGRGRISLRTTLWKALGSFAAIVTGGSVGREGPLIQFGAGAGGLVGRQLGLDAAQTRVLVAAGTAAGFAAAYNTPLAAVLFVLEIVTGVIALRVVVPVVVATALATWLTRLAIGGGPIYGLRTFALASGAEFAGYALLGALAGLAGPAFMALLGAGEGAFRRVPLSRPLRAALGGLLVGLFAAALPEVTGNGYEPIQLMLEARFAAGTLALLLVAKALATTSSVASGSPGGVFTPSMFLGAALGGLLGEGVARVLPAGMHGGPGGYALVGMAAMVAATTHAPLMAAVLVFELSGDYAVVLPLLLATTTATLLARRFRPDSIYTEELRRRGIPWEGTVSERLARAVRARDILEMDPQSVDASAPLDAALSLLERGGARVVYVRGGGRVRALDLHAAKEVWAARARGDGGRVPATAGEVAVEVPLAGPDDSLVALSEKLWAVDWGEVPVVDPADPGKLLGVVTRRAVLGAFDRELLQRDVLFTRVVWRDEGGEAADYLELPRGHRVEVIAPPARFVGGAVDPAAVRRDYAVTLLGVRHAMRASGEAPAWHDPAGGEPVDAADRWMVVGAPEAIARLRGPSPPG